MSVISKMAERQSGTEFRVAGINFKYITSDYHLHKTNRDQIIVLKNIDFFDLYEPMFFSSPTKNVLEFGVFEGGSIILFALAYPEFRFVGIDIRSPSEEVLRHIHDLGLKDRVSIHYNVSQADRDKIKSIVKNEFRDEKIGLISDDASHNYNYSRDTFEIAFTHLGCGGYYCLEDWAWAHWGGVFQTQQWIDQPALTNLVFELTMLCASTHQLIDRLDISPNLVRIRRGSKEFNDIKIANLIRMRGKSLSLI